MTEPIPKSRLVVVCLATMLVLAACSTPPRHAVRTEGATRRATGTSTTTAGCSETTSSTAAPLGLEIDRDHPRKSSSDFTGVHDAGRSADGRYLTAIQSDAFEISQWPRGTAPTAEQSAAAQRLVDGTLRGIRRYRDVSAAERAGYIRLDSFHWVKPSYIDDAHQVDPDFPESLLYVPNGCRQLLVAAMYLAPTGTHGEQVGGPLTAWHFHVYDPGPLCVINGGFPISFANGGRCPRGVATDQSAEMLHVWIYNPNGVFGSDMTVDPKWIPQIEARLRG